jgi:hypothetical protein
MISTRRGAVVICGAMASAADICVVASLGFDSTTES